jgi:hypothetical protein
MKEKIAALLERELEKLDRLSKSTPDGLELNDVRRIDLLIKAYSSYSAAETPKESPPEAPENQSTDDLLKALQISK